MKALYLMEFYNHKNENAYKIEIEYYTKQKYQKKPEIKVEKEQKKI